MVPQGKLILVVARRRAHKLGERWLALAEAVSSSLMRIVVKYTADWALRALAISSIKSLLLLSRLLNEISTILS